jgi:hypothetical protein
MMIRDDDTHVQAPPSLAPNDTFSKKVVTSVDDPRRVC